MNKIVCRLKGGLGNQLFSYAAARALSLKNDYELILDCKSGFKYDVLYERKYALSRFNITFRVATDSEIFEPFGRQRRYFHKMINQCLPFVERYYIEQEFSEYDERLTNLKPKRNVIYLDGLWQSEYYFNKYSKEICNDLIITAPKDMQNNNALRWIKTNFAVAIHLRWFDEEINTNNSLGRYYNEAIKFYKNRGYDYFAVFSDDIILSKKFLEMDSTKTLYVDWNRNEGSEVDDMYLMSNCSHFIIANSTFSWWAAWIGSFNKHNTVIYPKDTQKKYKSWSWDYLGQMPKDWVFINV